MRRGDRGLDVDGTLAKPIERQEARKLIENCIAVRLPKRVLVVDDSAAVRSVIQKVLKASRFRIDADEADGHASAVEQAQARRFDVVILDCHMSGMDGFETLAELRSKSVPMPRILMITEKQDSAMAERARGEGAARSPVQAVLRQGHRRSASAGCSGSGICAGVELKAVAACRRASARNAAAICRSCVGRG